MLTHDLNRVSIVHESGLSHHGVLVCATKIKTPDFSDRVLRR
jgi:hypothetical protein